MRLPFICQIKWPVVFRFGVVLSLIGLLPGVIREIKWAYGSWNRQLSGQPAYGMGCRDLVEHNLSPSASLFVIQSTHPGMRAFDRGRLQSYAWVMCPNPVRTGDECEIGNEDAVLAPDGNGWAPDFGKSGLDPSLFEKVGTVDMRGLWIRRDRPAAHLVKINRIKPSAMRELSGLLPFAAIAGGCFLIAGFTGLALGITLFSILLALSPSIGIRAHPSIVAFEAGIVLAVIGKLFNTRRTNESSSSPVVGRITFVGAFALCAFLALSHPFLPPNGLAVVGGKAKFLYMATDFSHLLSGKAALRCFEPAYPPGLAMLVYGCYGFSGACGDWLTQLVGCAAMAFVAAFLCSRTHSWWSSIWALTLFLDPMLLKMGALLYPEPLMALCVLTGWERLRKDNHNLIGWLLMGVAGWFKNEGLVFLAAAFLAWSVIMREVPRWKNLAVGLAIPMFWHVGSRLAGAHLNDYAFPWQASAAKGLTAFKAMLEQMFLRPWRYGFTYPFGFATVVLVVFRRRLAYSSRSFWAALLFAASSCTMFIGIYACSTAVDFEWHLSSSLYRLLWTPALVLASEMVRFVSSPPQNFNTIFAIIGENK